MTHDEYAVKGETFEGKVMTLRRGFGSRDDAEDHPVQMKLWKRVWVEPIKSPRADTAALPPLPWDCVTSAITDARGQFHAYLVDATGRKIAAIWGRPKEKQLTLEHILQAVNGSLIRSDGQTEGK